MSRTIEIPAADGIIDAHVFTPEGVKRALPGVLLFPDIGGLRPCYYEKAQTIADGGYAVLMPNIYYRDAPGEIVPPGRSFRDPEVRPTLFEYAERLTPAAQRHDFDMMLDWVAAAPEFAAGPVAAVGYCMTGAFALRLAAHAPEHVAAAAGFHPARLAVADDQDSPLHELERIRAQIYLGHADRDELMPPEQIARLDAAMATAGVHFTTELYRGAAHGYTARDAPAYDEVADTRHYKRLFTLLAETIG